MKRQHPLRWWSPGSRAASKRGKRWWKRRGHKRERQAAKKMPPWERDLLDGKIGRAPECGTSW